MLLTAAEAARHLDTSLEEDDLQRLLDANETAIASRFGTDGLSVSETHDGGQTYLFLRRRASAIGSITETDGTTETTLADDDWELRPDGISVRRLTNGTNARTWWATRVTVAFTAFDDIAERIRVLLALTELDLSHTPGVTSERLGDWQETKSGGGGQGLTYDQEREDILATLGAVPVGSGALGFA